LRPDDTRDALRKYGGLLLGLGVLMLLLRKGDDYSEFVVFVLLALPAVFLYGTGVLTGFATGGIRPWQAVFSVFGLIFVPLALFQFIELVDGTPGASLNVAWVFGLTAALAFYAGVVRGIRFHLLFGSIALIVAWTALWNKLLDDGIAAHFGTYRGLLGILAILLLVGAYYLWRTDSTARVTGTAVSDGGDTRMWRASELFTGAGIAAVLACSLGISSIATFVSPFGLTELTVVETARHWDILLLVISLGLVGLGATIGLRGPVYIGAIGLFLFLFIVGLDLDEDTPQPTNAGAWPFVLLVLGALGVGLSGLRQAGMGDRPRQSLEQLRGGGSAGAAKAAAPRASGAAKAAAPRASGAAKTTATKASGAAKTTAPKASGAAKGAASKSRGTAKSTAKKASASRSSSTKSSSSKSSSSKGGSGRSSGRSKK
jgi:hypothetical protein